MATLEETQAEAERLTAAIRKAIPGFPALQVSEGVMNSGRFYIRMSALKAEEVRLILCDTCEGAGWLEEQSYGNTNPPAGAVEIQRCDACGRYDGDIPAAVAYAATMTPRGTVHYVIGEDGLIAEGSDVWVLPHQMGEREVVTYSLIDADYHGWFHSPEDNREGI